MTPILFWSDYDNESSFIKWTNKKVRLSPLHHLALESHKKFKTGAKLFSYQEIVDTDYEVLDAGEILSPRLAFQILQSGHSIAHLSDYIRLMYTSEHTGIVLDLDGVVLRELPKTAFFSSIPAKRSGGVAPKWGKSFPPIRVYDESWDGKALLGFPVGVGEDMKSGIRDLAELTINRLLVDPKKKTSEGWNFVMWSLKDIPNNVDGLKVYEPLYFCPLPAWLPKGKCYSLESPTRLDGKTKAFGYTLPSIDDIFDKSFVVQHFFASAFKKANENMDYGLEFQKDSLLYKEAQYIFS